MQTRHNKGRGNKDKDTDRIGWSAWDGVTLVPSKDVQLGLLVRPAEVALEGVHDALLVVLEHVADLGDLRLAEGDGLCAPGRECLASGGMDLLLLLLVGMRSHCQR